HQLTVAPQEHQTRRRVLLHDRAADQVEIAGEHQLGLLELVAQDSLYLSRERERDHAPRAAAVEAHMTPFFRKTRRSHQSGPKVRLRIFELQSEVASKLTANVALRVEAHMTLFFRKTRQGRSPNCTPQL